MEKKEMKQGLGKPIEDAYKPKQEVISTDDIQCLASWTWVNWGAMNMYLLIHYVNPDTYWIIDTCWFWIALVAWVMIPFIFTGKEEAEWLRDIINK